MNWKTTVVLAWGEEVLTPHGFEAMPRASRQILAGAAIKVPEWHVAVKKLNHIMLRRHRASGARKIAPGQVNPIQNQDLRHLTLWTGQSPYTPDGEDAIPYEDLCLQEEIGPWNTLGFDKWGLLTYKEGGRQSGTTNLVVTSMAHAASAAGDQQQAGITNLMLDLTSVAQRAYAALCPPKPATAAGTIRSSASRPINRLPEISGHAVTFEIDRSDKAETAAPKSTAPENDARIAARQPRTSKQSGPSPGEPACRRKTVMSEDRTNGNARPSTGLKRVHDNTEELRASKRPRCNPDTNRHKATVLRT